MPLLLLLFRNLPRKENIKQLAVNETYITVTPFSRETDKRSTDPETKRKTTENQHRAKKSKENREKHRDPDWDQGVSKLYRDIGGAMKLALSQMQRTGAEGKGHEIST